MKTIVNIIIFILFYFIGSSQINEINQLKNWELLSYAKSAKRINDIYSQIDFYSEYYKRNFKNDKVNYELANLYFDVSDFKNSKPIFYKLYIKNSKKYPLSLFKYSQVLKSEEKYDSAISCFKIFKEDLITNDINEKNFYLLKTEREIEGCLLALLENKNNIKVYALNSSVNKAHKESSPFKWNDSTLVYSSFYIDSLPIIKIDQSSNLPVDKFYSAKLINNKWQGGFDPPQPFFNIDSLSCSNGVFSFDKKRFYFTVSNKNKIGLPESAIYISEYIGYKWNKPEKLNAEINLPNYISAQPTIGKCYNKNFEVIYFVSDRPGGIGGFDIWFTIYDKTNGEYKTPVNAGSYINTPGNEITPFIDRASKVLYFSSDAIAGYGGYDVYKTIGELVNWIPSKNLGFPINSPYNDIYYTKGEKDSSGFIVSNRSENKILKTPHCCYDIFQYDVIKKIDYTISGTIYEKDIDFNKYFTKKGNIKQTNKDTVKHTSLGSIVKLHIENKNNGEYICIDSDTTKNEGNFDFKIENNQDYMLTVSKENYTPVKIKFNTKNNKNRIYVLQPVTIIPINKEAISIDNIYFEFNKWELTDKSKKHIDTSLLTIMQQNKDFVIEISAHTDGIGDEYYNLDLSVKRVNNVVDYLTSMGIERVRIIAKGFGERKPIAGEFTESGEDNPEGRAKNRRIEFRLVGLLIENK